MNGDLAVKRKRLAEIEASKKRHESILETISAEIRHLESEVDALELNELGFQMHDLIIIGEAWHSTSIKSNPRTTPRIGTIAAICSVRGEGVHIEWIPDGVWTPDARVVTGGFCSLEHARAMRQAWIEAHANG